MGSPLSPIMANLYMESFKRRSLDLAPLKPKRWKCYVDDTDAVWPHGRSNLSQFLEHLNSQNNNIKFTMDIEENRSLPFLDVLVSRNSDGSISHQVFRKKTHIDRYLHANSHHFPPQKVGVINTLVTRALRILDREHIKEEIDHLEKVFEENGYNGKQFRKIVASSNKEKKEKKTIEKNDDNIHRIFLPYIKGTTDKLAKTLKRNKIQTFFTPPNTIRNMVNSLKDPINPKTYKGMYSIPCSCEKLYIGEIERSMETRFKEHSADLRHDRHKKSVLAEHSHLKSHQNMFGER